MKLRTLLLAVSLTASAAAVASAAYRLSDDPLWRLAPGDRGYVTSGTYYERGLAYNPVTDNVYLTHYDHHTSHLTVPVLRGNDGADLRELSTQGISGGFRPLRMIGVTDDGIILGGNMILGSSSDNFKLYRWDTESSQPVLAWEGDPSDGAPSDSERHYGHNLAVRGSGSGTIEVILIPATADDLSKRVALLTSTDGGNSFQLTNIETAATKRMNLGVAFGAGETFWASRAGRPLYELDFDGNVLREFDSSLIDDMLSPIAIDAERNILATIGSWNPHLRVYNLETLSTTGFNTQIAQRPFPDPNQNVERTGAVAIAPNAVYALDTNNGVMAYGLIPPPPEDPNLTWQLLPGQRPYLTTNYAERGLAYNPVTGNVYLTHWDGNGPVVPILDGMTGQHLGELSVSGISGGFRSLRMIGVSDDGQIFGGNQTTDSAATAYRLYRWENESSDPALVWEGDPSSGITGVIRGFGTNIAVRGGNGSPIEVLLVPDFWQQVEEKHVVARLISTDGGASFQADYIETQPTTRFGLGTAFGSGDTFWGTRAGQPLREFDFQGNLVRQFENNDMPAAISPFGINLDTGLLVGIVPGAVEIYDFNALLTSGGSHAPLFVQNFPATTANAERTGEIAFGADGMIYALDTNNGVIAFFPPASVEPVEPGAIFWTTLDAVRTGESGNAPRTTAESLNRAIGVAIDPENGYLFWAEDAGGRIWRANLDGTDPSIIVDIETSGASGGQFLDVNPSLQRVYWAEWTKGLFSANYDGTDIQHLYSQTSSTGVSVNRQSGEVYFGSAAAGQIWRIDADGSNPSQIASLGGQTYGIAVDPVRNRLYFTNISANTLKFLDLSTNAESPGRSGLGAPLGVAVAEGGNRLYWAERTNGRILTATVDETGIGEPMELFQGENSPFGIAAWTTTTGHGFDDWIAGFDIAPGQTGPGDDPDGDGIPNLLEYALGLNPTMADVSSLPVPEIASEGAGASYLTLTVNRDPTATGVSLFIEVSNDLIQWDRGPEHTTVLVGTPYLLQVRDNTSLSERDRRFLRVVAELD